MDSETERLRNKLGAVLLERNAQSHIIAELLEALKAIADGKYDGRTRIEMLHSIQAIAEAAIAKAEAK